MIVYDDVAQQEKIRIFDVRVETPPHYDTFAEFHYAYHYGDMYAPYVKQEEPLKTECQHFLECIRSGSEPLTGGKQGLELVRILEASSVSLKEHGVAVDVQTQTPKRVDVKLNFRVGAKVATARAGNGSRAGSRVPAPPKAPPRRNGRNETPLTPALLSNLAEVR